jgi:pyroglutamyl-peptidase
MSLSVLVTAFEPFGGRTLNASDEALARLLAQPDRLPGLTLIGRRLPVEAGRASEAVIRAIDEAQPAALVCLGEAKRDALCLERVGYNERHFNIPDNAGNLIEGQAILPGGPERYLATLPLEAMLRAVQATGTPVRFSENPGRYLCNEALYSALHHLAQSGRALPAGLIHVPLLPETINNPEDPCLPVEKTIRGLVAALGVLRDAPRNAWAASPPEADDAGM